jgi:hypothetical protein
LPGAAGADLVISTMASAPPPASRCRSVCLDATLPFGNSQCLPAGDLREFRSGLRRADLVLLTRADRLDPEQLQARIEGVRAVAQQQALPVHACAHAPRDVVVEPGGEVLPLASLRGRRALLLAAIARPQSFVDAARDPASRSWSWRVSRPLSVRRPNCCGSARSRARTRRWC